MASLNGRSHRGRKVLAWTASVSALAMISATGAAAQSTDEAQTQQATTPSAGTTAPVGTTSGSTGVVDAGQPANSTVNSDDTATDGAIVITGIRQSLANAQSLKRNSDTVVDAITAEDIGALPDRSVNEALQRVPGVAISRFAAPSDSQHFSVEGSGVTIRGLGYVRGEFNGRDTFAPNGGREIGFNDVPTELVGSVEVFKNLTADLVEGGIAGTVNINTRKPFDQKGQLIYLSAEANYGDFEKKWAPSFVGLYSNSWDLSGGGRIGFLVSGSYSQQYSRSDSVFLASMLPRYNDDTNGNGQQDAGEGRVINAGTPYQSTVWDRFPVPAGFDHVYAPVGGGSRTQDFNRKRIGFSGALQYENAARNFIITAQYLRTDARQDWLEHTEELNVWYGDVTATFPAAGTEYTFDENGIFTSGTITHTGNNPIQGNIPGVGWGNLDQFVTGGMFTTFSNRHFYQRGLTQDQSLNVKWDPTERLHLNFDGQYVNAKAWNVDDIVDTATWAQQSIDLRGKTPQIAFVTPGHDTADYFANPHDQYVRDAFNNRAINDGHEWAFRGDASYDISDEGFLRQFRFGARYADRKQTVRTNDYSNWGAPSETWTGNGPTYLDQLPDAIALYHFGNFFRGDAVTPPDVNFLSNDVLRDHDRLTEVLRQATQLGAGNYTPLEDRSCVTVKGFFCENEIYRNEEKTVAAYARLDFGTQAIGNGMSLSGNIGLRYVHTNDASFGALTLPTPNNIFTPTPDYSTVAEYCAFQLSHQDPGDVLPAICTISPEQQAQVTAFANGASVPDVVHNKFHHWLPSFNLKWQVTNDFLMRFAASKAISRPNFGDLRNYTGVGVSGANTTGVFGFQAQARNPYLRPIESNQFDVTAEWYFAKVGSLTGALFYKDLKNVIIDNSGYIRSVTNNGATFDVAVNGPANAAGKGHVKGAEVAYQQTYDFLPGLLRGFGLNTTFTYVKPGKIPTGLPANGAADGSRPPQDVSGIYNILPLAGYSKYNINFAPFYELGGFQARVAYSWRSKYLLTSRDCCFPFLPVYAKASGQLDASIFYDINAAIKVGIQAQNLTDTTTKTVFVLNSEGQTAPRSWFKSDRQYSFTVRTKF